MRVALISDTHLPSLIRTPDELGPALADFLATCELILHGGDVVRPSVLDWCEQFAPVVVAQGNNDAFEDPRMAERQLLELEGWRVGMVHDLRPGESRPVPELLATSLGGERVEYREGTVVINSGSPTLPHHKEFRLGTAALLEVKPGRLHAEIIHLGHSEGMPNPSTPRHIEIEDGRLIAHTHGGEAQPIENGETAMARGG